MLINNRKQIINNSLYAKNKWINTIKSCKLRKSSCGIYLPLRRHHHHLAVVVVHYFYFPVNAWKIRSLHHSPMRYILCLLIIWLYDKKERGKYTFYVLLLTITISSKLSASSCLYVSVRKSSIFSFRDCAVW